MITAKNLSSAEIDFSKLPAKFKEDYGDVVEMVPYMDQEPDFKQVVNSYVAGLNKELSKAKPKAKAKAKPAASNANKFKKGDRLKIVKGLKPEIDKFATFLKYDEKYPDVVRVRIFGQETSRSADNFELVERAKKPATKKPRKTSTDKKKKAAEIAAAKVDVAKMQKQAGAGEFAKFNRAQILEQAQAFHKRRRLSAQVLDESVDHKKRLTPTPENLVRWMNDPGKFDLIGIDTFEKNNPTADLKIKKEIFWHRLLKK